MMTLLKILVEPLTLNILLFFLAFLLVFKWPKIGIGLFVLAILMILSLSVPGIAIHWINYLERFPRLKEPFPKAGAIIVLGSGRYPYAPEYGVDEPSEFALVRLKYALFLAEKTQLPILTSGGKLGFATKSEAELSREILAQQGYKKVWIEPYSDSTWSNAQYSAKILKEKNIDTAFLVTHAWHMPRALYAFSHTPLTIIPAPTRFATEISDYQGIQRWLPSMKTYAYSRILLHELAGLWYYKMTSEKLRD